MSYRLTLGLQHYSRHVQGAKRLFIVVTYIWTDLMGFGSLGTAIRAIACILTLHLCHSVLAISPAERDLQILLKAFATNGDAFADYLNSLPVSKSFAP